MKKAAVRIVAALAIAIGGGIGIATSAHATPIWEPHGHTTIQAPMHDPN